MSRAYMVRAYWNVDVDIIYLDTLGWEKRSRNLQKMMPDRNISKWNISRSNMKKCWCRHYYLVEHVEELLRQAEQETGKKHGLDVWDELRLAHQTVQTRALLQTLHTQHAILREMKVRNQYWNWLSTTLGSCLYSFTLFWITVLHCHSIDKKK